jgi:hypothetical protein
MKKLLYLFVCVFLFSCSTVHKNISSIKKTEDSTVVSSKDTSSLSTNVKTADNFTAKGIDITVNFKNGVDTTSDSVKWTPIYVPKNDNKEQEGDQYITDLVQGAVSSLPTTGQIPSSISIHIDSLTNVDSTQVTKDSITGQNKSTVIVKTNTDNKDKVVSKTGLGAGVYIVGGIILLILIVIVVLKLGFKLW